MKATLQPSFGFPNDPIPVAYVVIILGNGERFVVSENSTGDAVLIRNFEYSVKSSRTSTNE